MLTLEEALKKVREGDMGDSQAIIKQLNENASEVCKTNDERYEVLQAIAEKGFLQSLSHVNADDAGTGFYPDDYQYKITETLAKNLAARVGDNSFKIVNTLNNFVAGHKIESIEPAVYKLATDCFCKVCAEVGLDRAFGEIARNDHLAKMIGPEADRLVPYISPDLAPAYHGRLIKFLMQLGLKAKKPDELREKDLQDSVGVSNLLANSYFFFDHSNENIEKIFDAAEKEDLAGDVIELVCDHAEAAEKCLVKFEITASGAKRLLDSRRDKVGDFYHIDSKEATKLFKFDKGIIDVIKNKKNIYTNNPDDFNQCAALLCFACVGNGIDPKSEKETLLNLLTHNAHTSRNIESIKRDILSLSRFKRTFGITAGEFDKFVEKNVKKEHLLGSTMTVEDALEVLKLPHAELKKQLEKSYYTARNFNDFVASLIVDGHKASDFMKIVDKIEQLPNDVRKEFDGMVVYRKPMDRLLSQFGLTSGVFTDEHPFLVFSVECANQYIKSMTTAYEGNKIPDAVLKAFLKFIETHPQTIQKHSRETTGLQMNVQNFLLKEFYNKAQENLFKEIIQVTHTKVHGGDERLEELAARNADLGEAKEFTHVTYNKLTKDLHELRRYLPISVRKLKEEHNALSLRLGDLIKFVQGKDLTKELVDKFEKTLEQHEHGVHRSRWSGMQRSVEHKQQQLVLNVTFSPQQISALKKDPDVWDFIEHVMPQKVHESTHPHVKNQLGWIRLTFDPKKRTALVDEVQSDLFSFLSGSNEFFPVEDYLSKDQVKFIHNVCKDFDKIAIHTVTQYCKTHGYNKIYYHTYEGGMKLKQNSPPKSLYTTTPKENYFKPTQDKPFDLDADFFERQARVALSIARNLMKN